MCGAWMGGKGPNWNWILQTRQMSSPSSTAASLAFSATVWQKGVVWKKLPDYCLYYLSFSLSVITHLLDNLAYFLFIHHGSFCHFLLFLFVFLLEGTNWLLQTKAPAAAPAVSASSDWLGDWRGRCSIRSPVCVRLIGVYFVITEIFCLKPFFCH